MRITCKFGGTSLATYENISMCKNIITSNPERTLVVVSAPGKRFCGDIKITDLLYQFPQSWSEIESRYLILAEQLNIGIDMQQILNDTQQEMLEKNNEEFNLSRGEYLSAKLISAYLGFEFLDAVDFIEFEENGISIEKTRKNAQKYIHSTKKYVIPGFYGIYNGIVKILPRGGSDVTGAVVANVFDTAVYENWTDVNGFMTDDPHKNALAKTIETLSYEQCRAMSLAGANVLYHSAVDFAQIKNIPIYIRNTFNPKFAGTRIGN